MSIVPAKYNLTKNVAGILNAIRHGIGGDYEAGVPVAANTTASIRQVGAAILAQQSRRNSFVESLVNRIGLEVIKSRQYQNPWAMFKKGFLEYGETVEEIFINLCEVHGFDPEDAQTTLHKVTKPSVSVAFHAMDVQAEYDVTISNAQLRQAFLSAQKLSSFIDGIIGGMYTSMNYDEFQLMKYLVARLALDGKLPKIAISTPSSATANGIMTEIKAVSNDFTFMKDKYTLAGNVNFTEKADQYLIESTDLNAILDVNVLASAFNMDKADFAGHVVLTDSFADIDMKRLAKLLNKDADFQPFNATELQALAKLRGVLCAGDFFQIYDVEQTMEDAKNGKGLSWNYFLHKWQVLSASPFENVALITDQTSTVSNVTITLESSTMSAAGSQIATAAVTRSGFANPGVEWSLAAGTGTATDLGNYIDIDQYGVITVKTGYTAGTWTVKATSLEDGTVSDTETLTLA